MRRQDGFTLLEILVTLVVVSFGLLGIAGIIANGLKDNLSSYGRSQASFLADDIIDRMRANRATAEGPGLPYNLAIGSNPAGTTDVPGQDLTDWRAALAATLTAGTGSVNVDAATRKVTVTVQWNDSRAAGGGTEQQFVVETRL
jgi:type IV pilus assembly protein PilV